MRAEAEKQIKELQSQPPAMVEFTLYFEDWREVDGVKFPHKIRRASPARPTRSGPSTRSRSIRRSTRRSSKAEGSVKSDVIRLAGALSGCGRWRWCWCRRGGRRAGAAARPATLRVVVKDPSGAVIPGRAVQITGAEPGDRGDRSRRRAVGRAGSRGGRAGCAPGRYAIEVSFPGFETAVDR